ncbi:GTP pyrophosphokinase [Bacillus mycoides]|uniref:GTP pyrophosphokinase n=1 Tax=Bacillus mycoides TaxID=1405 RepID=UPI001C014D28|nr:hypothetical protein [Bacillus mycoides]QWI58080.1 hypothetical protein EXW42_29050 [Bacillus mycoides]QWI92713.1 hypothetical protein J5W00_29185 [Bacillus mycoides]
MDISLIEKEFNNRHMIYQKLKEEGEYTLKSILETTDIKIHTILSRVKDKDSFLKKVERKESNKPFDEINDIVGLRIVCLFLSDVERIGEMIRQTFDVISEDNKINGFEDTSTFGYMSAHFIVKFKEEFKGIRYDNILDIPFEIQVRTISMDAWANISHYLDYKSEKDIPKELKRDFHAISGLFYVADTHFEMFFKESQNNKHILDEKVEAIVNKAESNLKQEKEQEQEQEQKQEQELNLDSLSSYLRKKFTDRRHCNSKDVSQLVSELTDLDYQTIEGLDSQIDKGWEAFLEYEKVYQPAGAKEYQDVGVVRMLLAIVDEEYRLFKYATDTKYKTFRHLLK